MLSSFLNRILVLIITAISSIAAFVTPLKQEVWQLMQKPSPTPILLENTRSLSTEEYSTMSGSFIKEFEVIIASGSGEGR